MKNLQFLIIIPIIILASCQKSEIGERKSTELGMVDFISKNATINAENMDAITLSAVNIHGKTTQINLQKEFKGKAKLNTSVSFSKTLRLDASENFKVIAYTDEIAMNEIVPTFGSRIKLSIEKSSANLKTETTEIEVYNPQLIRITNKDVLSSVSKEEDLTILWTKDEVNNKPVTISLLGRSQVESGQDLSNVDLAKLVEDTGSFTISKSDLQIFPNDIRLDIVLSRGNQEVANGNTVITMYNTDLVSSKIAKK
jgi:hypothetical protein